MINFLLKEWWKFWHILDMRRSIQFEQWDIDLMESYRPERIKQIFLLQQQMDIERKNMLALENNTTHEGRTNWTAAEVNFKGCQSGIDKIQRDIVLVDTQNKARYQKIKDTRDRIRVIRKS